MKDAGTDGATPKLGNGLIRGLFRLPPRISNFSISNIAMRFFGERNRDLDLQGRAYASVGQLRLSELFRSGCSHSILVQTAA
jgi:hypothetical protein